MPNNNLTLSKACLLPVNFTGFLEPHVLDADHEGLVSPFNRHQMKETTVYVRNADFSMRI